MPLLMIRQNFGTNVFHSVVMTEKPREATGRLGKEIARIVISPAVAALPLKVLARLFPVTGEGDDVSGPSSATVKRGLRKAERRAQRQPQKAEGATGA